MISGAADRATAILEIDLAGIAANWRSLAGLVEPAGCAAVVKADGYGLGARQVSAALAAAGCRLFFVATIDEGIAVRAALPESCEIAVLNGILPGCIGEFAEHRLLPVLNDPGQVAGWRAWVATHGHRPAMLHLDTGMSRLGLTTRVLDALAGEPRGDGVGAWRAVISHLACADEPMHPLNMIQHARFAAAQNCLPHRAASLAASSGIFLGREFHFDFVRPGAALYGVNPQPGRPNPMRQIARLKGRILQIRDVDRGDPVGYGATHVMSAPGRLATVAVGYADGWLRSLSSRGSGRLAGKRVPLVGRVSMDLAVFDVSEIDPVHAQPGGFIELLHEDYGVDNVAADAGTIGYEVLTGLGRRYCRVYRGATAPC
jgi:alanine racemase